jgi:hypothetical protein
MEQGLRIVAVGAFVLAAGCSSTTTTTVVAPTSTTPTPTSPGPTAIQHTDLVASAEAVGEQCDSPNPQGVTSCGDITFVDGDPELAKRFYDSRCFPTAQTGADLERVGLVRRGRLGVRAGLDDNHTRGRPSDIRQARCGRSGLPTKPRLEAKPRPVRQDGASALTVPFSAAGRPRLPQPLSPSPSPLMAH